MLNTEQRFSYFDPDYPTIGLTVTGLERVYSISIKLNSVSQSVRARRLQNDLETNKLCLPTLWENSQSYRWRVWKRGHFLWRCFHPAVRCSQFCRGTYCWSQTIHYVADVNGVSLIRRAKLSTADIFRDLHVNAYWSVAWRPFVAVDHKQLMVQ
jgi:hypothetical protein